MLVVEGEHTLNIANDDLKALRIFPNPVKDLLTVEGSLLKQANLLYITDLQGKKVMNIAKNTNTVDVSQLPAGAYLFTVKNSEGKTWDRKFIKQ